MSSNKYIRSLSETAVMCGADFVVTVSFSHAEWSKCESLRKQNSYKNKAFHKIIIRKLSRMNEPLIFPEITTRHHTFSPGTKCCSTCRRKMALLLQVQNNPPPRHTTSRKVHPFYRMQESSFFFKHQPNLNVILMIFHTETLTWYVEMRLLCEWTSHYLILFTI